MPRFALSIGTSVTLAFGLALACGPGDDRKAGAEGIADAFGDAAVFECECAADAAGLGDEFVAMCREQVGDLEQFFPFHCVEQAISGNAQAEAAFECLVDSTYDYVDCLIGEGCPVIFACSDGDQIPQEWLCDGSEDCSGGEDEQQDCPAPITCDGSELPTWSRCDGHEDCSDGSDEAGCPETCETVLFEAETRCPVPPQSVQAEVEACFPEEDPCDLDPEACSGVTSGPLGLAASTRTRARARARAAAQQLLAGRLAPR